MARNLRWLAVIAVLAAGVPAAAAGTASISGVIKDSSGAPQMGAVVEVFGPAAAATLKSFTDDRGRYRISNLLPGMYSVKVSAASFLPSLREDIPVRASSQVVVNLTLNTLFEALQLLPEQRRKADGDDDWQWTLRSVSNRPILRFKDDSGPLVVVSNGEKGNGRVLKARVAFLAGSEADGFGGASDMSTAFIVEQSLFSSGTLTFDGNVGYGEAQPAGVVRALYAHQMANGSEPEVAVTFRRFASPGTEVHDGALQALAVSVANNMNIGDLVELKYGGEFQTVQFMGRVTAFRPFGTVDLHLSPNTTVEYRYATSEPTTRLAKGFDSAPADLSESGPRMSLDGYTPQLEHARHQEISIARRQGNNRFQVAFYSDRLRNAALTGAGDVTADSGDFLPDVYSGTFTYNGGNLDTNGLRVSAAHKFGNDIIATVAYSYGGVLQLASPGILWDQVQDSLHAERRHAVTTLVSGHIPHCKTQWIASYKWTSGTPALTPVDLFNGSMSETDPYLNIFIRQPIPILGGWPGHMEALVDLRNLLAQGYVPVIGQDGHTLYLVQSARSIRGGVSFNF